MMAFRREKWKGYGPILFLIILDFALLAKVHGSCGPLPKLAYAVPVELSLQTDFPDETEVKFNCRPGYARNTSKTILTCVDNSWYPITPFCVKKRCPHPGELSNGRIIIKTDLEFGSKIEFSCLDGYILIGSSSSVCEIYESRVTWSEPLPTCEIVNCPPPPHISNGKYTNRDEFYSFGASVTYSCNSPFSLIGEASLSCIVENGSIGTWSPAPPICKIVSCRQPYLPNGKLTSGMRIKYAYKDTVLLECNRGYVLNGNNLISCGDDNQWHPAIPTCMINSCMKQPSIENAQLTSPRQESIFSVGTTLTFTCKYGYTATSDTPLTATCQEDFTWHFSGGFCRTCLEPKVFANGIYKKTSEKKIDGLRFSCNDGYALIGETEITCKNAKWSHPFPHCQALCPKPEVSNGKLFSEKIQYHASEKVSVYCSPGYYLAGSQIITCSENRSWVPEVPKCEWEFPGDCEKVSAGYKLMQCLPNAQDVKTSLEIHKLSLEIEMLELEIGKKRCTNLQPSPSPTKYSDKIERDQHSHIYD